MNLDGTDTMTWTGFPNSMRLTSNSEFPKLEMSLTESWSPKIGVTDRNVGCTALVGLA